MSRSEPDAMPNNPATAAPLTAQSASRLIVYFDASCPLCRAEIGHYARQPGAERLSFVDVSTCDGLVAPDLSVPDAMARFHVRLPDGQLISGARAFQAIWRVLPGWWWAARLTRLPGMIPVLEAGYRLFLPLRPALSRLARRLAGHQDPSCACAGPPR